MAILVAGGLIALAIATASRLPAGSSSASVLTAGEPYIGSPSAPVTLAYWFDFQCPYCKRTEALTLPQLGRDYVKSGIVKVVFKDLQFLGPDSENAGVFGRAVWEVDPTRYYDWHQAVFARQDTENAGWGNVADLAELTQEVLGATEAARVSGLVSQKRDTYLAQLSADRAEGARLGVNATPGLLINGTLVSGSVPYADISSAIEAARKH